MMNKTLLAAFAALLAPLGFQAGDARAELNVIASIKPVHSLVAGVMQGVGTPHLLLEAGSPHTYSLKPSDATALQQAQVVFYIGPELETFLEEPLKTLAGKAKVVALDDADGLTRLAYREGGNWEKHKHGDDDHDGHDHETHAKHEKHEHKGEKHTGDKHDEHEHDETDMHLWLDPMNGRAMLGAIAAALAAADPTNAATYKANAESVQAKLDTLTTELAAVLAPNKARSYMVFHDAYQYFEKRFALSGVGSVTVSPEKQPGAKHLAELRKKIKKLKVSCVFAEPQFEPKLVQTIVEGSKAKTGMLDPIGAAIPAGPDLYFTLLRNNADAFAACMK